MTWEMLAKFSLQLQIATPVDTALPAMTKWGAFDNRQSLRLKFFCDDRVVSAKYLLGECSSQRTQSAARHNRQAMGSADSTELRIKSAGPYGGVAAGKKLYQRATSNSSIQFYRPGSRRRLSMGAANKFLTAKALLCT